MAKKSSSVLNPGALRNFQCLETSTLTLIARPFPAKMFAAMRLRPVSFICWKEVAMLITLRKFSTFAALAFLLTACGGGGDSSPAFLEIDAAVGGRPVPGFVAFPGTRQALFVPVGLSFELDATRPVTWSVFVGGVFVPGRGNTLTSNGTSIQETVVTNAQYVASTFGFAPGPAPFQITIVATSLEDPGQVATVDVLVTN